MSPINTNTHTAHITSTAADANCDQPPSPPTNGSQKGEIAVASSVTAFAVGSIVFFIVGFLCGNFCQKRRKLVAETDSVPPTGGQTQTPYYDDVVLKPEVKLKQEVELKENVAYGQIR